MARKPEPTVQAREEPLRVKQGPANRQQTGFPERLAHPPVRAGERPAWRRGEPALDIDAEVAKLAAAPAARAPRDEGIADEVRQLVVARNERRERQGLEPLDVQAEVTRTLAELGP